jgi:hypothetical protein
VYAAFLHGSGPFACAVFEVGHDALSLIRACGLRKLRADESLADTFYSIAAGLDGTLWISGAREPVDQVGGKAFLLRRAKDGWHEEPLNDYGGLSVGADGTLWMVDGEPRFRAANGWTSVPIDIASTEYAIGVFAKSPRDAWIATNQRVFHFDGERLSAVPLEDSGPFPSIQRIRGAGQRVWAASQRCVWELEVRSAKGAVPDRAKNRAISLKRGPNGFRSIFGGGSAVALVPQKPNQPISPCACHPTDVFCAISCSANQHRACAERCATSPASSGP